MLLACVAARAQTDTTPDRFWLSGQANVITQWHPDFAAAYSGPNSLRNVLEDRTSHVFTLYTGVRLTGRLELLLDAESASGRGISDALGLAGFTNLDVVRNPNLGSAPYIARLMLHYTLPLSREQKNAERSPLSLASRVPVRRLEFRAGKFSTVDFFDVNAVGSDSHLQFLNWTADNNGAYDYAADTRGYTYGAYVEYHDRAWAVRFAEELMPEVANGYRLSWDLAHSRAENFETEWHPQWLSGRNSSVRALVFINHANMGSYKEAIAAYLAGQDTAPNIIAHRRRGRIKEGIGINSEQELTAAWRVFARAGWNEGHNESFAYTEVDNAAAAGSDIRGNSWRRADDKFGVAFLSNGISPDHQRYLALGGLGFLLGDGGLSYGREQIVEFYYNARLWGGIYAAFDEQHINNPGYNRARGPVWVSAVRLHAEQDFLSALHRARH